MSVKAEKNRELGKLERGVAVALILIFLLFVWIMFRMRNDEQWDRLVFLFGSVEALVFGAAGALFGASMQRSQTADAQEQAESAEEERGQMREEAESAKDMVARAEGQALGGRMLRRAVLAKRNRLRMSADHAVTGEGLKRTEGELERDLEDLVALAEEMRVPGT